MDEFSFENTVKLTESEYVAVWTLLPSWGRRRVVRFGLLVALGIIFLFTSYTLLLGLALLGLAAIGLFVPVIVPGGARDQFRRHEYLKDALTYGVSDQKLWIKGDRFDTSVSWSMLVTWRETESWLVLSPSGIPPLYLSLARLKNEGLYGRVRALASSNAPEFNKSNSPSR